jgi:PKD repeat protein
LADVALSGSALSVTVPPQSITLYVFATGAPNQAPVAAASALPTSGVAPLVVAFTGSGSYDSDGSIASYAWTFGDGATASSANPSHTYATAGSYSARLTVTDDRGATGTATVPITATSDPNVINAPSGLTASAPRKGGVAMKWTDNSANEQGFYVERAPSGSTSFARIGQTSANTTSFSQSGVAAGQYVYRVQAFNSTTGVVSAYSNTVSVRVK